MASGSATEVDPSSLLSPIGRLITDKPFHNLGIHAAIFRSWHFILSLEIEELLGNDYLFSFQDLESRNQILHLSPWTIKGHLLIVKPLVSGCLFSELDLSHTPIWVQVHGLPMTSSTVVEARAAGSRIGSVLEVDFRSSQKVWIIQFIRMKVEQGVTQPLILKVFFSLAWDAKIAGSSLATIAFLIFASGVVVWGILSVSALARLWFLSDERGSMLLYE